jgi:hypothetical protein
MGFASGSVSFKRFFVDGQGEAQVDQSLLDKLSSKAMGADSIRTADQTELGWTTGEHILDVEFDFEKNAVADGLHFALRVDTNKPPGDLVRSYQRMNEQTMLEASGREFLSKAQRKEAREQALSKAEAEARSGMFKRMKQVPAFWDLKRNEVYFCGSSNQVVDQFMLLFRQTFDRNLTPATAGEMAARWSAGAGQARAFDECQPAHFVQPPEGADIENPSEGLGEARERDFLGTEWLTWLWYAAHVESPELAGRQGQPITVLFEKSLQLECAYKISGSLGVKADGPTRLPEAMVGLAGGKRPVKGGLQLAVHGDVFSLGIRGDVMNFSGVKLPPPEDAATPRMVFEDRIDHLRDLIDAVNDLYVVFLKRRLSGKWNNTLNAMRNWIASGRQVSTGEQNALRLEAAS